MSEFKDAKKSGFGLPCIVENGVVLAMFKHLHLSVNGELWADATNVYTQTGLTPTELAGQRAQLKRALEMIMEVMPADAPAKGQLVGIEGKYLDAISFSKSVLRNSNYKAH